MKSLIDKIDETFSKLSASNRKIAEYLYDNLNEALLIDSAQLAKKCNVSEATVSRFINNLGYTGIKEFKQEIGKIVLREYSSPSKLDETQNGLAKSNSVLEAIAVGDISNIDTLHSLVTKDIFDKAVKSICSAKTLYIVGLRSNFALSFYLHFHLRYFIESIVLVQAGAGDIADQLYKMGQGDVLIIISFKRHPRLAAKITERAKIKGAEIIAITNHNLSPIGKLSDISLIAKTEVPSYIESPTASMTLLNALITAVSVKNKKKSFSNLSDLENELNEFDVYRKEFRHKLLSS